VEQRKRKRPAVALKERPISRVGKEAGIEREGLRGWSSARGTQLNRASRTGGSPQCIRDAKSARPLKQRKRKRPAVAFRCVGDAKRPTREADGSRCELIGGRGGAGEGEDYAGEEERIEEVVDPHDFGLSAGVGQGHKQNRPVDEHNQEQNPGAETGGGEARLFGQQDGRAGEEKNCAGEVVDEQVRGNPFGQHFLERDAGDSLWVQEMFNAIKNGGDGDDEAAQG